MSAVAAIGEEEGEDRKERRERERDQDCSLLLSPFAAAAVCSYLG